MADTSTALNQPARSRSSWTARQPTPASTSDPRRQRAVSGDFKESEARSLSNSLKYGALPLKFDTTT